MIIKRSIAITALFLSAHASVLSSPISVKNDNITRTFQFKVWKSNLDKTDKVGKFSKGLFCGDTSDIYYRFDEYFLNRVDKTLLEIAENLGYPKYQGAESAFEDKLGGEPDFRLGATLLALNYDICGDNEEFRGKARIKLKLELFSTNRQRVVYSKALEADFNSDQKLSNEAFDNALIKKALNQAFSDNEFVDAFKNGGPAETAKAGSQALAIENPQKFTGGVQKNSKPLLSATITIESGVGSGSGFYVGKDGYILTNQHVVGSAKYVKVKLSEGHSLVGEVIRFDQARDVALVKTESSPPVAIPIRKSPAKVGEEVYAIGSPMGAQLSGTLTRGVVSSQRNIGNTNYIQSDVAINSGNSGGPLIDAEGSILGIAQIKASGTEGISLFIPIDEALEKLGLQLK